MNRTEKQKFIKQVIETAEDPILDEVYHLLDSSKTNAMERAKLDDYHELQINKSFEDMKHGRVFTHTDASKIANEWLAKYR